MLHILLIILKIIGILLLSILAIIVLLILTILLVPIRYVAKGEFDKEGKGEIKVSWLLSLFTFLLVYDNGKIKSYFKIFGYALKEKKSKELVSTIKEDVEEFADDIKTPIRDAIEVDLDEASNSTKNKENEEKKNTSKMSLLVRLKFTFRKFCDRIKSIKDNKNRFFEFIKDEENKKVFKLIKRQVFALLRCVRPRRLQGNLEVGFEDPSLTGYFLGFISMWYPIYYKSFSIRGNFETVIIKGNIFLKGRIRVISLLIISLKLLMDKNFRKMIRIIKK